MGALGFAPRTCTKCGTCKPPEDFYLNRGRIAARCKACHNAYCRGRASKTQRWKSDAYKAWKKRNVARLRLYHREAYKKRKDLFRASMLRHVAKMKNAVYRLYGGACACCGERLRSMLDLDHVNGGGNAERRGRSDSLYLYRRLSKETAPDPRYQILCCNCNQSKRRNRGTCEHAEGSSAFGWCV